MDDIRAHTGTSPPAEQLTPEIVFREYLPRVYRLARHLLGNDADAEDVTQDVFVQIMRKLSTFRGESTFTTWLHHVTVNAALAYRRKKKIREEHRSRDSLEDVLDTGEHTVPARSWSQPPDQLALDHESHDLIEEAIAHMPEAYRDVYVLSDVEGVSNADIGSMLGLSLPAVKSRLHRARLMMRDALAPYFEEVAS
jgi:RNA polymerase sigma-70 factor (ECF subfamily)